MPPSAQSSGAQAARTGSAGDDTLEGLASPGVTLGLRLKDDPAVRDLMLLYVAMILNHHRLCHAHRPPHLPLNLVELFQATQQVGAFQVRVQRTLAKVLFSSFHDDRFWSHWGDWMVQVLHSWRLAVPAGCLTPGLLPLQPGSEDWSWRETVVIQALALEAAHALVERLPLHAEALATLLGLQEALVEDSSRVDPKGFETVPLGLPLLPNQGERVTVGPVDFTSRQGLLIQVEISPHSPDAVSGPRILCQWLWGLMQRFGLEVSELGLVWVADQGWADRPWQTMIDYEGAELLRRLAQDYPSLGLGLRALSRQVDCLAYSRVLWQEQRLDLAQVQGQEGWLWEIRARQVLSPLGLQGGLGSDLPVYQRAPMTALQVSVRPGEWCDRLVQVYGAQGNDQLRLLSQMARQVLSLHARRDRLGVRVALFLVMQFWRQGPTQWTVGALLEAVESPKWIHGLVSSSMRRDCFFQAWAAMWAGFERLGWQVSQNPLLAWEARPLADLGWMEAWVSIRIGTDALPVESRGVRETPGVMRSGGTPSGPARRRMDKISSRALGRALAARGMSQAKLARSLNLDRSTINRWINGSRPIHARYRPMLWELLGAELQQF